MAALFLVPYRAGIEAKLGNDRQPHAGFSKTTSCDCGQGLLEMYVRQRETIVYIFAEGILGVMDDSVDAHDIVVDVLPTHRC